MRSDGLHLPLGEFLRSRRAAMPAVSDRRRVPGWRREEVAAAASVSIDYYIRLEQGRATHPSADVVDALAATFELDDHERVFLHRLAAGEAEPAPTEADADFLPSELLDLIEVIRSPAFIMDEDLDIRAWNGLASHVIHDFDAARLDGRVNLALLTFTNSTFRSSYDDWDAKAHTVAAMLRFRQPTRPRLSEIIDELLATSPSFAAIWSEWEVAEKQRGIARLRHPVGGLLDTSFQLMPVAGTRFELAVYTTPSGSPSRAFLDSAAENTASESADSSNLGSPGR